MSAKKAKYLCLQEKAIILNLLQKGASATALARQYGVTKSAISKIKNKKESILKCVNNTDYGPGKRKTLRASELPTMEKCLYRWFTEQRQRNHPINSIKLKEKAKEIHLKLKEKNITFNASDGWLQGFKKRFGVRLLKITGEKLSSQPQIVKIEEMGQCHDQLYNADESGLPEKSYVSSAEWQNLLSFTGDPEDTIPINIQKEEIDTEIQQLTARKVDVLNELNPQVDYTVPFIQEWNEEVLVNDAGACKNEELEVTDDDDPLWAPLQRNQAMDENVQTIKPSEAVEIFDRALNWAECENVDLKDLNVLRRLREKAVFQLIERKRHQKKITDFFK